ncbi:hypothetical protein [Ectobacillus funiculus]|uniref:Uncharacterized protein n=1 Tax=Ectobacillus funiculus TaxID=137993 RepID=A0ABV5WJU5_9BACI
MNHVSMKTICAISAPYSAIGCTMMVSKEAFVSLFLFEDFVFLAFGVTRA